MAKPTSIFFLFLLLLLTVATHFEGFDGDELDNDDDRSFPLPQTPSSISTLTAEYELPLPPPVQSQSSDSSAESYNPALDDWDEDEFEGIPSQNPNPDPSSPSDLNATSSPPSPPSIRSFTIEIVCVSFLFMFAANYFTGKPQNELIALSFASAFATKDSIFNKNFSLLGTGDGADDSPLLLKEGHDVFKFYASGRRFCQGLLATMELKGRHDLIARAVDLVMSKNDVVTVEVVMNEEAMNHVVMAVTRKKVARVMQKECGDLVRFVGAVVGGVESGRKWLIDELMVDIE